MKAAINLEFGSEELQDILTNMAVKGIVRTLDATFGNDDPTNRQAILALFQQALGQVMSQMPSVGVRRGPAAPPGPFGGPVPGYGPMPQPFVGAPYGAPPAQQYVHPSQQAAAPDNVRPFRSTGAVVEKCFPIEGTRLTEPGYACCRCATFNGVQRTRCRHCGHPRCDVVVTPPPQPPDPAP